MSDKTILTVGRSQPPCPTCEDTWAWPTYPDALLLRGIRQESKKVWTCRGCFLAGKEM